MEIKKICSICGVEYTVPHWRKDKSKYCSVKCQHESLKAAPNLTCAVCGKEFHRKPFHIKRYKGDLGYCCSKACITELKRVRMSGKNNHQYGLRGNLNASHKHRDLFIRNNNNIDVFIYVGEWYKKYHNSGRVAEHRYLVELNHSLYPDEYFNEIDGWYYLKDGLHVHHKDCNHRNNLLENLQILSKSEHVRTHNLLSPRNRNSKGRFISNRHENKI